MNPAPTIACPKCLQAFAPAEEAGRRSVEQPCGQCGTRLQVETFPRLLAGEESAADRHARASLLAQEGEAVCRFYPELQAQTVCDECGCFLSEKAAVTWGEQTLCLPCLHLLRESKETDSFAARRTLVDNVGLGLTVFLLPLSLLTGPIAVVYLLRNRRKPGSLIPRTRFRWWLALVLSAAISLAWLLLIILWIASLVSAVTS